MSGLANFDDVFAPGKIKDQAMRPARKHGKIKNGANIFAQTPEAIGDLRFFLQGKVGQGYSIDQSNQTDNDNDFKQGKSRGCPVG